jgi:hypothetical protein
MTWAVRVEVPALSSVLALAHWSYWRLTCYRTLGKTSHRADWARHNTGSEPEVARRTRRKSCCRQECRLGNLDIPCIAPVGLTGF